MIFVKTMKTGGSSLEYYLTDFFNHEDDIITRLLEEKNSGNSKRSKNYLRSNKKVFNFNIFIDFIKSLFKILPFVNRFFKFNYKPRLKIWEGPFFIENFKFKEHEFVKDIKKKVGNDFFNKAFKFTIIRNPYDTFISFFFWQKHRQHITENTEFLEFTKENCEYFFNRQLSIILLNGKIPFDFIIKYENFDKDIEVIKKKLNYYNNTLVFKKIDFKRNITPENKYNILCENSKKIIEEKAKPFFDLFNYKKI